MDLFEFAVSKEVWVNPWLKKIDIDMYIANEIYIFQYIQVSERLHSTYSPRWHCGCPEILQRTVSSQYCVHGTYSPRWNRGCLKSKSFETIIISFHIFFKISRSQYVRRTLSSLALNIGECSIIRRIDESQTLGFSAWGCCLPDSSQVCPTNYVSIYIYIYM